MTLDKEEYRGGPARDTGPATQDLNLTSSASHHTREQHVPDGGVTSDLEKKDETVKKKLETAAW